MSLVEDEMLGLMKLALPLPRFMDQRGVPHARLPTGDRSCVPLRSNAFEVWAAGAFYKEFGQAFTSPQALRATTRTLEALALKEGTVHRMEPRFATRPDGSVLVDLKDAAGRAVVVTPDGWRIDPEGGYFRRLDHMQPLPEPIDGGDLRSLAKFINVSETDFMLLSVYLVLTMVRGIPRPMLLFYGPAGAAKTSAANWVRDLVDPTTARSLAIQTSERELSLAVDQHAVPTFDNVTRFSRDIADALCRVCTGGSFSKRRLRTDEEVVLLEYLRPMMVTCINPPSDATDLVDRMLMLELGRVPEGQRKTMAELNAAFELERPKLTGALLTALSFVLREQATWEDRGNLGRLADFHRLGRIAAVALGYTVETFDQAFNEKTMAQSWTAAEDDGVARLISELLHSLDRKTPGYFEGSMTELHEDLLRRAKGIQRKALPKKSAALGKRVREVQPVLQRLGISAKFSTVTKLGRRITLTSASAVSEPAVMAEPPEKSAA